MKSVEQLLSRFDPVSGQIAGAPETRRYLNDLRGCFFDTVAYESALQSGNPLLYSVASVEFGSADGDLHYGLGRLMPGQVGSEYYMTKGHFHSWREASEVYIGLGGQGVMLLEEEASDASQIVPLAPHQIVYVPGNTAHRTINTGPEPLVYLGVYPAKAGHDYSAIAKRNFRKVLIERHGKPTLIERSDLSVR